jgi:peptidoglycan/xylan/chitin deacetylase (PgdA/CDA1 family)
VLIADTRAVAAEIEIVLRMDDSGFGRHAPTVEVGLLTDAEITRRVMEITAKYGAKLSIAVIPNVVSGTPGYHPSEPEYRLLSSCQEELGVLRDAAKSNRVEICLHGWTHEQLTLYQRHPSEFGGRPLEDQVARLARGREELERCLGIPIEVFVPPFNNHDHTTLLALRELGFKAISSDAGEFDDIEGLRYVPYTTGLKGLRSVLTEAGRSTRATFIGVLFHGQEFKESGCFSRALLSLDDFDDLLHEVSANPNVRFTTIAAAAGSGKREFNAEGSRLYAAYRDRAGRVADMVRLLGPLGAALRSRIPSGKIVFPDDFMRRAAVLMLILEVITALVLFVAIVFAGYILMASVGRYTWVRHLSKVVFVVSVCCMVFFLLEGTFGILGYLGFGSRLVMAMSCDAAVLLVTTDHWRRQVPGKTARDAL